MLIACDNPLEVVKEAFWLAWIACGGPLGMGILQNKLSATKEDVWKCVADAADYPGGKSFGLGAKDGKAYGDYVFGRMMKLELKWNADGVTCHDREPRRDYQAWCGSYPTYELLVRTAASNTQTAPETV